MKCYKITENNITYDIEETDCGNKYWILNDLYHRDNGPAIEYSDGSKSWYKNGLYHRVGGPAVEWADGSIEYWYNGEILDIKSDKELKRYIKLLSIS